MMKDRGGEKRLQGCPSVSAFNGGRKGNDILSRSCWMKAAGGKGGGSSCPAGMWIWIGTGHGGHKRLQK